MSFGQATGRPDRLNRSTVVNYGGAGTETYARKELRVEIASMMTGERLGVGHEPRHGTTSTSARGSRAFENDPREIRAGASPQGRPWSGICCAASRPVTGAATSTSRR